MRTVIVEDEKKNLQYLKALLAKHFKQVEVIATATDAEEGIKAIIAFKPDLVLLDIELPGRNGLEMLEALGTYSFDVVFITAFDQYAVRAFRAAALDYVVKPIKLEDLYQAITRAEQKKYNHDTTKQVATLLSNMKSGSEGQLIVLPLIGKTHYINVKDIIRCESKNGYTSFYINGEKTITVSYGMRKYAEVLESYRFIRCSQSIFVNRQYVKCMNNKANKVSELEMKDGSTVIIPIMRKEMVRQALEEK